MHCYAQDLTKRENEILIKINLQYTSWESYFHKELSISAWNIDSTRSVANHTFAGIHSHINPQKDAARCNTVFIDKTKLVVNVPYNSSFSHL